MKWFSLYPSFLQPARSEPPPAQTQILLCALEQCVDSVMITDANGIITYVNAAFERITGFSKRETLGRTASLLRSGRMSAAFYAQLWAQLRAGRVFKAIFINRRKNGELYSEEKTITPLTDENGQITHYISTARDVTERLRTQDQLHRLSHFDLLTGLNNRGAFLSLGERVLERARLDNHRVAVVLADVDHFGQLNAIHGQNVGDALLVEMAERLSRLCQSEHLARTSGRGFAWLMTDPAPDTVLTQAMRPLQSWQTPCPCDNVSLPITVSAGIALFPDDAENFFDLLHKAQLAKRLAKQGGGGISQRYQPELGLRESGDSRLCAELRTALGNAELSVFYQPIFDLTWNRLVSVEALLRWDHPQHGMLSPAIFLPLAQRSGLMPQLNRYVSDIACTALSRINDGRERPLRLSINLSVGQFADPGLPDTMRQVLTRTGFPPGLLTVEVDSAALSGPQARPDGALAALGALGIELAIDDFGLGHLALEALRRLPVQAVKLDRQLVGRLDSDPLAENVARASLLLARELGLTLIAEGIETPRQIQWLQQQGCHFGQGYLLAKPMSATALAEYLDSDQCRFGSELL